MVNLPIVKTFNKMISPKKFEKFFSQKCTMNVCLNSDLLDTFLIKNFFFFSTYLNYSQHAIQRTTLCST